MEPIERPHDPYAAFRHPGYRAYFLANFLGVFGSQMVATAVGWTLYAKTGKPLTLGLVGLALALPHFLLFLPAGNAADRYDRKRIFFSAQCALLLASLTLGITHVLSGGGQRFSALAWLHPHAGLSQNVYLVLVYGALVLMGCAFAFLIPSKQSLFPRLVTEEAVPNAVTWNSTAFQVAAISGPALAGFLLKGSSAGTVFFIDAALSVLVLTLVSTFRYEHKPDGNQAVDWSSLVEGIRFVGTHRLLLAAITLDLFAVLFGGAVALLPVFATDILHRDSVALGYLRAAPFAGAILMATFLAHRPMRNAGRTLLWAVAGFGVATVVFGFSRNFWLSLGMMALLGCLDSVSVILRGTLVQVFTPDHLLGRVQAVNFLFIISSNELGAFESGVVAEAFGPVFSVVFGGVMSILVVLLVIRLWPEILKLDKLEKPAASAP
jgi:MFS family permease